MCNVKIPERAVGKRKLTTSGIHTTAIFDLVHLLIPLPESGLNIGLAALLPDRRSNVKARNKDPKFSSVPRNLCWMS